jgi:hypothetical protein
MSTLADARLLVEQRLKHRANECYVLMLDGRPAGDFEHTIPVTLLPPSQINYIFICFYIAANNTEEWGYLPLVPLRQPAVLSPDDASQEDVASLDENGRPLPLKAAEVTLRRGLCSLHMPLPTGPVFLGYHLKDQPMRHFPTLNVQAVLFQRRRLLEFTYGDDTEACPEYLYELLHLLTEEAVVEDRFGYLLTAASWRKLAVAMPPSDQQVLSQYVIEAERRLFVYRARTCLGVRYKATYETFKRPLKTSDGFAQPLCEADKFRRVVKKMLRQLDGGPTHEKFGFRPPNNPDLLADWMVENIKLLKQAQDAMAIEELRQLQESPFYDGYRPAKRPKRARVEVEYDEDFSAAHPDYVRFLEMIKAAPECIQELCKDVLPEAQGGHSREMDEKKHKVLVNFLVHMKVGVNVYRCLLQPKLLALNHASEIDDKCRFYTWYQRKLEDNREKTSQQLQHGCGSIVKCGGCPYTSEDTKMARRACQKDLQQRLQLPKLDYIYPFNPIVYTNRLLATPPPPLLLPPPPSSPDTPASPASPCSDSDATLDF